MTAERMPPEMVRGVAKALDGLVLPFEEDPMARIVEAHVDRVDPFLVHVHWLYRGVIRVHDVPVSEASFDVTDADDIASLIRWEIVEAVDTMEWEL
jgi:hypothetical protein